MLFSLLLSHQQLDKWVGQFYRVDDYPPTNNTYVLLACCLATFGGGLIHKAEIHGDNAFLDGVWVLWKWGWHWSSMLRNWECLACMVESHSLTVLKKGNFWHLNDEFWKASSFASSIACFTIASCLTHTIPKSHYHPLPTPPHNN